MKYSIAAAICFGALTRVAAGAFQTIVQVHLRGLCFRHSRAGPTGIAEVCYSCFFFASVRLVGRSLPLCEHTSNNSPVPLHPAAPAGASSSSTTYQLSCQSNVRMLFTGCDHFTAAPTRQKWLLTGEYCRAWRGATFGRSARHTKRIILLNVFRFCMNVEPGRTTACIARNAATNQTPRGFVAGSRFSGHQTVIGSDQRN